MTWLRRALMASGRFWVITAVVPVWLMAGALIISVTAVVLESRPTPRAAGAVLVAFALAWTAATVGVTVLVVRRRRRRQERFVPA